MIQKQILFYLSLFLFAGMVACADQPEEDASIETIRADGKIASIIRNPVSANQPADTVNVAKIRFEETVYDFGNIDEGGTVRRTFRFTNTGKVPLVINNARATCGCTVPEWPKSPIGPGESGEIKVKFDTTNKKGSQNKPVTISANTYPAETKIYLKGYVDALEE
jgi:hypothetical protein